MHPAIGDFPYIATSPGVPEKCPLAANAVNNNANTVQTVTE